MAAPPEYPDDVFIGKHIPWKLVEGEVFRITDFGPFATVEGDKVKALSVFMPYALLAVESPILNQPALMPILHRAEFLNLHEIYEQRGVGTEEEVLVSYLPYRGFLGPLLRLLGLPRLHLRIRPKGELERYYADDQHWQRPSARETFFTSRWCSNCTGRIHTFTVRCPRCGRPVVD